MAYWYNLSSLSKHLDNVHQLDSCLHYGKSKLGAKMVTDYDYLDDEDNPIYYFELKTMWDFKAFALFANTRKP